MPPSAIYVYWVTHAAVIAILLAVSLTGLFYAGRLLWSALHRRFPRDTR